MRNHTLKRLCLAALVLSGIGWGAGRWYAKRTDVDMRQRLLRQVVSIARTFRPERVRELSFTDADVGAPAFEYIRQQMIAFGQYLPQRGIYSMAMRDGTLVFGPENYRQDDPMASPPGTVYERPSPADMAIFTTGKPVAIGPATDEYGTFVSALAPVLDPDTGQVLMAVGMDITADDWLATTARAGRNATGATVAAGLVVLGGLTGILRRRRRLTSDHRRPKAVAAHDADQDRAGSGARRFACTGLLLGMGVLAIAFLAVVLLQSWHWTHAEIHRSADQQTRLAAEFDLALRDYMSRCVRPEMEKRIEPGEFFPETMSTSFISRSVFDNVRRAFPDSILRFASTNPRNPANQATPSEEALIRYFEQHPEIDAWSGTMSFFEDGQRHSVHAKARRFQPSCLQCHGRPEDAPAALVERYGDSAGFGRLVGEVSLDLAAIPVSAAHAQARTRIWRYMLASCALCILFLGAIIILIRLDIRQRRRSEASLRASGQRLARIIQQSPIPTFLIDANRRVTHWNRALERLTGITADQVIGTQEHWRAFYACERPCLADLLVDGSIEAIPQWYQGSSQKSELIDEAYEASAYFPDVGQGGRWLHFTAAVIRDDQDRIVGAMETLEDITERKRAEEELQRHEAFIRAVLDNIPIGVAVNSIDPVVRFEYMNDNFPRFYRTTREALAGPDRFWEAVYEDPDLRNEMRRRVLEDCAGGDPERMHWDDIPITREGQETTFVSTKNAILPGRPLMISIVWDVTKRNRAENRLKESLSLLKATLESTADGILVVDGQGRVKDFNEQFRELWRLPAEVLEMMDDQRVLAATLPQLKDPDVFVTTLRMLYRRPGQEGHGTLHFKDGRVVEYCLKPQSLGERIVGLVWSFRDVTKAYHAQQEQDRLLRRVAAINEELSHFAYVVSHDLKAPLRGIKMLAEWLSADCGDQLGDEAKENLDLLQNRVDRMHNLIEGVLQYSRIGRITEDVVSVDLNVLLPEIIDAIAPPAHIAVRVEGRLPVIECEKTRITQVFQNLLSNAVKYMDKPAGEVVVACSEDADAWTFSVSDNGPGIEEKYFDRIFKIFQTLVSRDEYESTGVGLALVKKIVEQYGGRVWLASEVGKGSTFFFTFPTDNQRTHREKLQTSAVG
jgi:PAS domain S-box-containing protein